MLYALLPEEHFLSSVRTPGSVVPRLQSRFTYTVVTMKHTGLQDGPRSRKRCKKGGPAKIYWNLQVTNVYVLYDTTLPRLFRKYVSSVNIEGF